MIGKTSAISFTESHIRKRQCQECSTELTISPAATKIVDTTEAGSTQAVDTSTRRLLTIWTNCKFVNTIWCKRLVEESVKISSYWIDCQWSVQDSKDWRKWRRCSRCRTGRWCRSLPPSCPSRKLLKPITSFQKETTVARARHLAPLMDRANGKHRARVTVDFVLHSRSPNSCNADTKHDHSRKDRCGFIANFKKNWPIGLASTKLRTSPSLPTNCCK